MPVIGTQGVRGSKGMARRPCCNPTPLRRTSHEEEGHAQDEHVAWRAVRSKRQKQRQQRERARLRVDAPKYMSVDTSLVISSLVAK